MPALARIFGLSDDEYARIPVLLGRPPTLTELGMFAAMWSEHCSYKSSRAYLGQLPREGERVILGPGENAGVVDIGDGDALIFKMESHNHPSFIEPYQGAATGVGGIMRDIFTMGARPIACLDLLRFGRPAAPRMAHLIERVVAGIAGYGNALGVPTVGGEVGFDAAFDGNILVNVMAVGLARRDGIFGAQAAGVGNKLFYLGARTGRDGIHGATMASAQFGVAGAAEKRPTVQVGDPLAEKLLIEACLELVNSGAIVGLQDMGAAGLTSAAVEMASRGGSGIEIDLDQVPRREAGMSPYEVMLSESQERMLLCAEPGREEEVRALCAKWDIACVAIGRVTATGKIVVRSQGAVVADLALPPLTDGLCYERPAARPARQGAPCEYILDTPKDFNAALLRLLAQPQIAAKDWVFRQYDHMVRGATVLGPGGDAAVLRILHAGPLGQPAGMSSAEGSKGIALTVDGNSRFCFLDPYEGARHAVAEAYRNISAVGGEPLAITDCLNLGSPERPEVMWQLREMIRGLADACRALGTPVVSGNVSLYNETVSHDGPRAILPTPAVGMVGLLPDVTVALGAAFPQAQLEVALLGPLLSPLAGTTGGTDDLAGSQYLASLDRPLEGVPPGLDLAMERAVGRVCRELIQKRLLSSAHDCSEGGLAVALAESCLLGQVPVGIEVFVDSALAHGATLLFGEAPSRMVISYHPEKSKEIENFVRAAGVPWLRLGMTGGPRVTIRQQEGPLVDVDLQEAAHAYHHGFSAALET